MSSNPNKPPPFQFGQPPAGQQAGGQFNPEFKAELPKTPTPTSSTFAQATANKAAAKKVPEVVFGEPASSAGAAQTEATEPPDDRPLFLPRPPTPDPALIAAVAARRKEAYDRDGHTLGPTDKETDLLSLERQIDAINKLRGPGNEVSEEERKAMQEKLAKLRQVQWYNEVLQQAREDGKNTVDLSHFKRLIEEMDKIPTDTLRLLKTTQVHAGTGQQGKTDDAKDQEIEELKRQLKAHCDEEKQALRTQFENELTSVIDDSKEKDKLVQELREYKLNSTTKVMDANSAKLELARKLDQVEEAKLELERKLEQVVEEKKNCAKEKRTVAKENNALKKEKQQLDDQVKALSAGDRAQNVLGMIAENSDLKEKNKVLYEAKKKADDALMTTFARRKEEQEKTNRIQELFDGLTKEHEKVLPEYNDLKAKHEQSQAGFDKDIAQLNETLSKREARIDELEKEIANKNGEIERLSEEKKEEGGLAKAEAAYKAKQDEDQEKIANLQKEKDELLAAVIDAKQTLEQYEAKIREVDDLKAELEKREETIQALENKIEDQQLFGVEGDGDISAWAQDPAEIQERDAKIKDLETRIQQKDKKIEWQKATLDKLEAAERAWHRNRSDLDRYREEHGKTVEELSTRNTALEGEKNGLAKDLELKKSLLVETRQKLVKAERTIHSQKAKLERCEKHIEELGTRNVTLKEDNKELAEKLQNAQEQVATGADSGNDTRIQDLEKEVEGLKQEAEVQRMEVVGLEARNREAQMALGQAQAARDAVGAQLATLEQELAAAQAKLTERENELTIWRANLDEAKHDLKAAQQEAQQQPSSSTTLAALEAERVRLSTDLEKAKHDLEAAQKEAQEYSSTSNTTLADLEAEGDKLKKELASAKRKQEDAVRNAKKISSALMKDLEAERAALKAELDNSTKTIDQLRLKLRECEEHRKNSTADDNPEIERLKAQVEELEEALVEAQKAHEKLQAEHEETAAQLTTLQEKVANETGSWPLSSLFGGGKTTNKDSEMKGLQDRITDLEWNLVGSEEKRKELKCRLDEVHRELAASREHDPDSTPIRPRTPGNTEGYPSQLPGNSNASDSPETMPPCSSDQSGSSDAQPKPPTEPKSESSYAEPPAESDEIPEDPTEMRAKIRRLLVIKNRFHNEIIRQCRIIDRHQQDLDAVAEKAAVYARAKSPQEAEALIEQARRERESHQRTVPDAEQMARYAQEMEQVLSQSEGNLGLTAAANNELTSMEKWKANAMGAHQDLFDWYWSKVETAPDDWRGDLAQIKTMLDNLDATQIALRERAETEGPDSSVTRDVQIGNLPPQQRAKEYYLLACEETGIPPQGHDGVSEDELRQPEMRKAIEIALAKGAEKQNAQQSQEAAEGLPASDGKSHPESSNIPRPATSLPPAAPTSDFISGTTSNPPKNTPPQGGGGSGGGDPDDDPGDDDHGNGGGNRNGNVRPRTPPGRNHEDKAAIYSTGAPPARSWTRWLLLISLLALALFAYLVGNGWRESKVLRGGYGYYYHGGLSGAPFEISFRFWTFCFVVFIGWFGVFLFGFAVWNTAILGDFVNELATALITTLKARQILVREG